MAHAFAGEDMSEGGEGVVEWVTSMSELSEAVPQRVRLPGLPIWAGRRRGCKWRVACAVRRNVLPSESLTTTAMILTDADGKPSKSPERDEEVPPPYIAPFPGLIREACISVFGPQAAAPQLCPGDLLCPRKTRRSGKSSST